MTIKYNEVLSDLQKFCDQLMVRSYHDTKIEKEAPVLLHITVGDDYWNPTQEELSFVVDLFTASDDEGIVVATGNKVKSWTSASLPKFLDVLEDGYERYCTEPMTFETFKERVLTYLEGNKYRLTLRDTDGIGREERRKAELTYLNAVLRKKNIALDAMVWVWCSGGCEGGTLSYSANADKVELEVPKELTLEMVEAAERNVQRMRQWYNNHAFKEKWAAMSQSERSEWLADRRFE